MRRERGDDPSDRIGAGDKRHGVRWVLDRGGGDLHEGPVLPRRVGPIAATAREREDDEQRGYDDAFQRCWSGPDGDRRYCEQRCQHLKRHDVAIDAEDREPRGVGDRRSRDEVARDRRQRAARNTAKQNERGGYRQSAVGRNDAVVLERDLAHALRVLTEQERIGEPCPDAVGQEARVAIVLRNPVGRLEERVEIGKQRIAVVPPQHRHPRPAGDREPQQHAKAEQERAQDATEKVSAHKKESRAEPHRERRRRQLEPHRPADQNARAHNPGHIGATERHGIVTPDLRRVTEHECRTEQRETDQIVVEGGAHETEMAAAGDADEGDNCRGNADGDGRPDRAHTGESSPGDIEQCNVVEAVHRTERKPGRARRQRGSDQIERQVNDRIVERSDMRRAEVVPESVTKKSVGVVPVVIPQVPVGILSMTQ